MATGPLCSSTSDMVTVGQAIIIAHPSVVGAELRDSFVHDLALLFSEIRQALEFGDQSMHPASV